MLVISPNAFSALEASARPAFAEQVRVALAEKYPHFLPRFPDALQSRIVGNMLGRASLWGLNLQSALMAWCEFMIAVAANFDEEPEIRALLDQERPRLNLSIASLPDRVSEQAWARADAAGSVLPFFVPPAMMAESRAVRSAEAIRIVLADRPEAGLADRAVAAAEPVAADLGIAMFEDALLVTAACTAFYGSQAGWLDALRAEGWRGRALMEAMRLRLALDFGRYA